MIKFLDLHKINTRYTEGFSKNLNAFLESGYYILGNKVSEFERQFASYCGTKFCIGTGNGLDALTLILRGYIELGKLKEGDKIMVAANTYIATILSIKHAGLRPVLIEPDEKTFNISVEEVSKRMSADIKAIVPTHLYGQLADMKSINTIAKRYGVLVIADAAQGHGAKDDDGKMAGSLCDASSFSFYPTKNLGALGDGGAITTDDNALETVVRKLRNYGSSAKDVNDHIGWNSRLDELQAAFLITKLPDLDSDNKKRRLIASRYLKEIKNKSISLPYWNHSANHVFHVFIIRVEHRDHFCKYLKDHNIGFLIHYPTAPHKQKALLEFSNQDLPLTENIHAQVVSLPLHPMLLEDEITEIIKVVNGY